MGPPLYSVRLRERETANLASVEADASDTPPPLSPNDGRDSPPPLMPVEGRDSPPPLMGPPEPGRMDGENVDRMWAATSWPVPWREGPLHDGGENGATSGTEENLDGGTNGGVHVNWGRVEAFRAWANRRVDVSAIYALWRVHPL